MLEVFFISKVRVKILKLYVLSQNTAYHVREVVRQTNEEINAVRRELIHLEKEGLFSKEQRFNRVYYTLNRSYPLFPELRAMIYKEYTLGGSIIKERENLGDIKLAVLGSKYINDLPMDPEQLDLLIVGEQIAMERLNILIKTVELDYKREINYSVLNLEQFITQRKKPTGYVKNLLEKSKIFLIGSEDDL